MSVTKTAGIYTITCEPTGWVYVGKSFNVLTRWAFHQLRLMQGRHVNKRLQRQWAHYGAAAFRFKVEEIYPSDVHEEYLAERESELIRQHVKAGKCFNVYMG